MKMSLKRRVILGIATLAVAIGIAGAATTPAASASHRAPTNAGRTIVGGGHW